MILISMVTAASVLGSATVAPAAPHDDVSVTLAEIRETRSLVLKETDEPEFFFPQDAPGLRLSFDLTLPDGVLFQGVDQPNTVRAMDSTGRDLSKIEPGFMGEREYITEETISFGEDRPQEKLVFTLGLPARAADSFSLMAEANATVYTGTESAEQPVTEEWTELDPALFGGEEVRMRRGRAFGSPGVEFVPVSAQRYIDDIALKVGDRTLERGGSVSDGQSITYFFNGEVDPGSSPSVAITVRTGLREVVLRFEVQDQNLP